MHFTIQKSFLKNYWSKRLAEREIIEKARKGEQVANHKYFFRKETGNPEKPYIYFWEDDFLTKPIKKLAEFFGITEKQQDELYEKNDIKKDFNADKKTFAQHLSEYFAHRKLWDFRFSDKSNRQKHEKPVKMEVSNKLPEQKGMETPKAESQQLTLIEDPKEEKKWKANPSLMKRIWSMYTGKKVEKLEEEKALAEAKVEETKKQLEEVKADTETKEEKTSELYSAETMEKAKEWAENLKADDERIKAENEDRKKKFNDFITGSQAAQWVKKHAKKLKKVTDVIDNILNGTPEEKEKLKMHYFEVAETGDILKQYGLIGDNITVRYGVITKHNGKNDNHNLSKENWKEISEKINNPFMITKANDGSFRVFVDTKVNGNYVMVALVVKSTGRNLNVNSVNTIFGKEHENNSEILYINPKIKSEQLALLNESNLRQYLTTHHDLILPPDFFTVKGNNAAEIYKQEHNLTQNEYESLDEYTQSPYVNSDLRNDSKLSENETTIIKDLDEVIAKNTVKENKLYRGVTIKSIFPDMNIAEFRYLRAKLMNPGFEVPEEDWVDTKKYTNLKENVTKYLNELSGKAVTDKAYTSTSKDFEVASEFAAGYSNDQDGVIIEFNVPEGTKGIDLEGFQGSKGTKRENEVLLARNTKYEITGTKVENGKFVITADILPPAETVNLGENEENRKSVASDYYDSEIANFSNYVQEEKTKIENEIQRKKDKLKYMNEKYPETNVDTKEHIVELGQNIDLLKITSAFKNGMSDEKIAEYIQRNVKQFIQQNAVTEAANQVKRSLSEAMMGNQNAAGKHNVQPQTDSEMKKEQEETKKARKEAGLPDIGINYGERVSAMEDSVSLNPNAENYAYKDTGYIAGSQKEKIQDFWKRKKESGEGTSIEEIDWNTLEENPRYAAQQITKENILGDVDYSKYQENGMKPTVAYLISRVYAAIPKEPVGNTVESRKNYVIAINTLRDRLESCKSIKEIKDVVDDIYGEYKQTYDSQVARSPEVKEITEKRDELAVKSNEVRFKIIQWARDKLIPEFKDKGKHERKALFRYKDEIQKKLNDKVKEYDPDFEGDIYYQLENNPFLPLNLDGSEIYKKEKDRLYDELKAARTKARTDIATVNTTHDVWKELGEKFCELRYSKSYQNHCNNLSSYDDKYLKDENENILKNPDGSLKETLNYRYRDKTYDKFEGWSWVERKKIVKEKSDIIDTRVKRRFEMIVPATIERVGGRDVSVKSTEELKKAFNFRDIQTGSYVQSDPVSAKWHIDNLAAGFADLADVLGIRDDQISLNGRLAVAVGARGHGKALAHYEPVERVINITKMKGGGSLGHEWFHSFDNMITEAMNGGNYAVYMSDPYKQSKIYRLADAFKPNAAYDPIPENESTQKVKAKFDNLVKAMMEGDTPETEVITYKASDVEVGKKLFEGDSFYYSYYGDNFRKNLKACKTLDEAIKVINERYKASVDMIRANAGKISKFSSYEQKRLKQTVKNYESYRAAAVAYFDTKEDKSNGGEGIVLTGRTVSRFYEDAKFLDGDKEKPYWSTPVEMAARSFEAYLVDKLKSMGRKNDYLSGSADNDVYSGRYYPYPTERDRVKINKAFDELFEVIRSENAIRKAIAILDRKVFVKDGRIFVKKSLFSSERFREFCKSLTK